MIFAKGLQNYKKNIITASLSEFQDAFVFEDWLLENIKWSGWIQNKLTILALGTCMYQLVQHSMYVLRLLSSPFCCNSYSSLCNSQPRFRHFDKDLKQFLSNSLVYILVLKLLYDSFTVFTSWF